MAHPLDGLRLKLLRAEEHLRALDDAIGVYIDGDIHQLVRDEHAKEDTFYLWIKEQPPARLSVIFGDCIYNLRSALDHLAWQLVLSNHGTPTRRTSFPIFNDASLYAKQHAPCVRGMSIAATTLIETFQPYHAGKNSAQHALWFVHELSNADKHRTLILTAALLTRAQVRLVVDNMEIGTWPGIFTSETIGRVFQHGAKLATFPFPPDEATRARVQVEAKGDMFVALQDSGPWGQHPVQILTENTYKFLRDVLLPAFEPFF